MTNTKFFLSLIAAVSLSLPAVAQTSSTEAEAPKAEETTEDAGTTNELETAFPVAQEEGEIKVGQQYTRETFDDWEVRCIKAAEGTADTCGLYQLLKDGEGNGVAEFNLVALPKGGQAAGGVTFVTPLGTLLTAQTTMRVDSGKAKKYPFSWCERSGCVARFGLTNAELTSLKRGNVAKLTISSIAAPEKPIELDLSLKGVTAALNAVTPE